MPKPRKRRKPGGAPKQSGASRLGCLFGFGGGADADAADDGAAAAEPSDDDAVGEALDDLAERAPLGEVELMIELTYDASRDFFR